MQDDGHFDERIAATYDADEAAFADVASAVELLAWLALDGPVLEFAIGTGRLALPLVERGLTIEGLELSRAMVRRLREKPCGDAIPVTIGDMSEAALDRRFRLVFLAFNTITNLTTQQAQLSCFRNASAHLEPGGRFLVEVGVPPLQRLPLGERLLPFALTDDHWGVDEIDVTTQAFASHHIRKRGETLERHSIPFRYVWPSELDLMAKMAGMQLEHRWGGWRKEPFTPRSTAHVSVWIKNPV